MHIHEQRAITSCDARPGFSRRDLPEGCPGNCPGWKCSEGILSGGCPRKCSGWNLGWRMSEGIFGRANGGGNFREELSGSACMIRSLYVQRLWFLPPWLTHRHTETHAQTDSFWPVVPIGVARILSGGALFCPKSWRPFFSRRPHRPSKYTSKSKPLSKNCRKNRLLLWLGVHFLSWGCT